MTPHLAESIALSYFRTGPANCPDWVRALVIAPLPAMGQSAMRLMIRRGCGFNGERVPA